MWIFKIGKKNRNIYITFWTIRLTAIELRKQMIATSWKFKYSKKLFSKESTNFKLTASIEFIIVTLYFRNQISDAAPNRGQILFKCSVLFPFHF